jgi:hypothetical protein
MPGATGQHSYGTRLYYAAFGTANPDGANPGATMALLTEIISINGLPMNPSVTKITHLNSDGKAHEKIPGFLDAGQITLKMNRSSTLMAEIAANLQIDGTEAYPDWGRLEYCIEFPEGDQWFATAFLQGSPFEVPEDDRTTVELTLEISGRPVFTSGTVIFAAMGGMAFRFKPARRQSPGVPFSRCTGGAWQRK